MKPTINYKRIKREILKRDTALDSRFTTKSVESKKVYSRKKSANKIVFIEN